MNIWNFIQSVLNWLIDRYKKNQAWVSNLEKDLLGAKPPFGWREADSRVPNIRKTWLYKDDLVVDRYLYIQKNTQRGLVVGRQGKRCRPCGPPFCTPNRYRKFGGPCL